MGAAISEVSQTLDNKKDDPTAECAKENLRQCEDTAQMVCNNFRLQVQERYKNPGEFDKWQVCGGRQDREDSFIGVATDTKPSTDLTAGVDSLVKGIFGVEKGTGDSADAFHEAIGRGATAVCNAFLGNASAGSSTHSTFLIIPHGYTFHRVDILMYKYTFSSKAFTAHYTSQTVVYVSRGILSPAEHLKPDELVNYLSEMFDENSVEMMNWMQTFSKLHKQAQELQPGEVPANTEQAMLDPR